jgi:hypothetical protein
MSQTEVRTTTNGTSDRQRASKRQAWRNFIQVPILTEFLEYLEQRVDDT